MAATSRPTRSIYDVSVRRTEPRPRTAAYLVIAGSFFVLLEALLFLELLQLIVGLFLFIVGLLIFAEPHHHLPNGALAVALSVLSLLFGFGGFYFGAILAAIGGILAIIWSPPKSPAAALVSSSARYGT